MNIEDSTEYFEADVIEAAGGVIWRETGRGRDMALIHRARYDDWTLPKGKLEAGERWQEGALREIKEETGCDVEIVSFAGAVGYTVKGVAKVVLFWNMKAAGECAFGLWLTASRSMVSSSAWRTLACWPSGFFAASVLARLMVRPV